MRSNSHVNISPEHDMELQGVDRALDRSVDRAIASGLHGGLSKETLRQLLDSPEGRECRECRTMFRFEKGDGFVVNSQAGNSNSSFVVCPTCDLMRECFVRPYVTTKPFTGTIHPHWPRVGYRGITNYVYSDFIPEHVIVPGGGPCYKCSETSCSKIYDQQQGWVNTCLAHHYPQIAAWDKWVHQGTPDGVLTVRPGPGQKDILVHARKYLAQLNGQQSKNA